MSYAYHLEVQGDMAIVAKALALLSARLDISHHISLPAVEHGPLAVLPVFSYIFQATGTDEENKSIQYEESSVSSATACRQIVCD